MARLIPARLDQILQGSFDELEEADLARLIGLREDEDLDFKRELYERNRDGSQELASDVASFANTRGGLIVIGMDERDGEATEFDPVAFPSDEEELRINQVVTSHTAPRPGFKVRLIPTPSDPSRGYVLLGIPLSPLRPHAVSHGERLRYVVRTGPAKRALYESEVANAYRARFEAAASRAERLDRIHEEIEGRLDRDERAWVVLSLTPDAPGTMEMRRGVPEKLRDWALDQRENGLPFWPRVGEGRVYASTKLRAVSLTDELGRRSGRAYRFHGEFYTDGSAAAGLVVGARRRTERMGEPEHDLENTWDGPATLVFDENLTTAVANLLYLSAHHAIQNAGTWGEATVQAEVVPEVDPARMVLYRPRSDLAGPLSGTRYTERTGTTRHTVDLEEAAAPGPGLLAATRFIANDLVAAFGLPEILQISAAAELHPRQFQRDKQSALRDWAHTHGVSLD